MTRSITAGELQTYLTTITNHLLDELPLLKDQRGLAATIVDDTTRLLRYKEEKSNSPLTKDDLMHPDFIKHLSQAIITQATLIGSAEETQFLEELIAAINQLKASAAYHAELKSVLQEQEALLNDLNEIMNDLMEMMELDPTAANKIHDKLRKKMQKKLNQKMSKKLEKLLSLLLNPKNKASLRDALRKLMNELRANIEKLKKNKSHDKTVRPLNEDIYINLFGLLNSYIAGSIAVPLTQYIGNGLGFNDWNPYHGYANIDKINEINFMFGDSLGVEGDTLRNFLAIEDDVVNALTDLLRAEGLTSEPSAPQPFAIDKGPKTHG